MNNVQNSGIKKQPISDKDRATAEERAARYGGRVLGAQASSSSDRATAEERAARYGGRVLEPETPQISPEDKDSFERMIARYGKTVLASAIGAIPDTAALAYNLPAMASNYAFGTEAPMIPSVREGIEQGIDKVTGGYTNIKPEDKYKHEALSFGTQIFAPGAAAVKLGAKAAELGSKGLDYLSKGANAIGSTKKSVLASGAVGGGATQLAMDDGAGALGAIGSGIGASLGTTAALGVLSRGKGLKLKTLRHDPKDIDLDAVKAFEKVGLDYPASVVNTSNKRGGIASLEKHVINTPLIGGSYNNQLQRIESDFSKKASNVVKSVGKKIDNPLEPALALNEAGDRIQETVRKAKDQALKIKSQLYDEATKSLPHGDRVLPTESFDAIRDLSRLDLSILPSTTEQMVKKEIRKYRDYITDMDKQELRSTPVENLVATKVSLNETIYDILKKGEGGSEKAADALDRLRSAIVGDIKNYGNKNPEWYKKFKEADDFYGFNFGENAFGSNTVKTILDQKNLEKILPKINNYSDFMNLENVLGKTKKAKDFLQSVKREKVERIFGDHIDIKKNNDVKHSDFLDLMNNESQAKLIKYLTGDVNYGKLRDLAAISERILERNKRYTKDIATNYQRLTLKDNGKLQLKDSTNIKNIWAGVQNVIFGGSFSKIVTGNKLLKQSVDYARRGEKIIELSDKIADSIKSGNKEQVKSLRAQQNKLVQENKQWKDFFNKEILKETIKTNVKDKAKEAVAFGRSMAMNTNNEQKEKKKSMFYLDLTKKPLLSR